MLHSMRKIWCALLGKPCKRTKAATSAPVRRVRLMLERLEERDCPANLAWIGSDGGLWSVATNWRNIDTGQVAQAGAGAEDSLHFTAADANTSSFCNITEVKDVFVQAPTFNKLLTLSNTLTITGSFVLASGIIDGSSIDNTLTLSKDTSQFTWTGGALKDLVLDLGVVNMGVATRPTTTISGAGTKSLENVAATNYGKIIWSGTGDLIATNVGQTLITNQLGGEFRITGTGALLVVRARAGYTSFVNKGTLDFNSPGEVAFDALLSNIGGTLVLSSGTLNARADLLGTGVGISQFNNGVTRMEGGNLDISRVNAQNQRVLGYFDSHGTLRGSGQIIGMLINAGVVEVGELVQNTFRGAGALNIIGTYDDYDFSQLIIHFELNGDTISQVNVSANLNWTNATGVATIRGTLTFIDDNPLAAIHPTNLSLPFMTYVQVINDFNTINYPQDFANNHFSVLKQPLVYSLRVN